ncbi:Tn3 family transposase [Nostoc sp.]|uniref:Tn3 family transposase n=1 Tax=Nostoc sp. TaxID=1180 RepID=UPI003FA52C6D
MQKSFPRKHPLTWALQEYGRLIKTVHILRWYADEINRRRHNRQINKGEAQTSLEYPVSASTFPCNTPLV